MNDKTDSTPDFEKALAELEELVRKLESGSLSLDESLTEFRKGVELTRHCQSVLDRAQQSVEQLLDIDDEDSATPFDPDANA
jgi:exodeoxyribonuclease VII small subunit